MTLESAASKQIYEGNGAAREFPVPFKYARTDDIRLLFTDASGEEHEIGENFQIAVTSSGDATAVYPVAGGPIPAGTTLTVYRATPKTQIVDLENTGAFNPDVLEHDGFDRLEMQIQELQEEIYRSIKSSLSSKDPPPFVGDFYRQLAELFEGYHAQLAAIRDGAEVSADRAEAAANETYLESGVFNLRRVFAAPADIDAGGTLALPVGYYPARASMLLNWQGLPCVPKDADAGNTGKYQYEEVGDDPDTLSYTVKVGFPVRAGEVIDVWVVTSALGRNLDAIRAIAEQVASLAAQAQSGMLAAGVYAQNAADGAAAASDSAANAASSATGAASSAAAAQSCAQDAAGIKEDIESLQGIVTYLDGRDFGDPADRADWQQTLTDYALAQVPEWSAVPNSCDIVNQWDGHEWIYNIETGRWIDFGASAVASATNATAGIVRGNAAVTGKISVGSDGEMTVNTIPPQITKLASALAANGVFSVPEYRMGSGMLKIYLNGLLCPPGASGADGFYKEIDATTIRIFEALPAGATITAVSSA
ncbi:MAG: hypothetical protein LBU06_05710 [Desulfovibrio sp.]|jgi:hypothetical protein|nr:hypothetical protein [Desulfovibrio sp.]